MVLVLVQVLSTVWEMENILEEEKRKNIILMVVLSVCLFDFNQHGQVEA